MLALLGQHSGQAKDDKCGHDKVDHAHDAHVHEAWRELLEHQPVIVDKAGTGIVVLPVQRARLRAESGKKKQQVGI